MCKSGGLVLSMPLHIPLINFWKQDISFAELGNKPLDGSQL